MNGQGNYKNSGKERAEHKARQTVLKKDGKFNLYCIVHLSEIERIFLLWKYIDNDTHIKSLKTHYS